MSDLLYKDEVFKLVGLCMEIHRELGKGQDAATLYDEVLAGTAVRTYGLEVT